jgi:hypothetical protein
MPSVYFTGGFFPFPVVDAAPWNRSDWYEIKLFRGDPPAATGSISIPGKTGNASTRGDLQADGSPINEYLPVLGPGTPYPVGMALDSAVKMFWRVKTWALTVNNVYGDNPSGEGTVENLSAIVPGGQQPYVAFTTPPSQTTPSLPNEGALVNAPGAFYVGTSSGSGEGNDGDIVCGAFLAPFGGLSLFYFAFNNYVSPEFDSDPPLACGIAGPPAICRDPATNLYYPLIVFGAPWLLIGLLSSVSALGKTYATGATLGPLAGTFTFDEPSLKMTFNTSGSYETFAASQTMIMQPKEFWPYDPGDGKGPYFNTITGAQIRH